MDTKLFADHSLATCQFLKDKVGFFFFRITDVLGRVSEDKNAGKILLLRVLV